MKHWIHPAYGHVAFRDRATGHVTLTRSTLVDPIEQRYGRRA